MSSNPQTPELSDFFFELSNQDRLDIMKLIDKRPLKLSHISKELDLPMQEISRQLNRLMKVKLVTKNIEGSYTDTLFGKNMLELLPCYQFLSEHIDYFNKHTFLTLPRRLSSRIGELRKCSPVSSILVSFANIEKMVQEAEEYIFHMADQRLMSPQAYFLVNAALHRGVEMKGIEPLGYSAPFEVYGKIPITVTTSIAEYRVNGVKMDKVLPTIELSIFMSEKEVALLAFPSIIGEFEYIGFTSNDEDFREWCFDVHQYYWNQAKVRTDYDD